ncbi:hypothetical protein, partial [Aeromonas dhakensis]|uniref:hypothetical protein n=1 Tax=Aeromonas dhakensis TaxID=196024 RepID=UPI002B4849ED
MQNKKLKIPQCIAQIRTYFNLITRAGVIATEPCVDNRKHPVTEGSPLRGSPFGAACGRSSQQAALLEP